MGGLMGIATDATGIQFKVLNKSRGPAVWSPRAQADKRGYGRWMRAALEAAVGEGVVAIGAGNYGGKLGPHHFHLRKIMA